MEGLLAMGEGGAWAAIVEITGAGVREPPASRGLGRVGTASPARPLRPRGAHSPHRVRSREGDCIRGGSMPAVHSRARRHAGTPGWFRPGIALGRSHGPDEWDSIPRDCYDRPMLRIGGGEFRSRHLETPPDNVTRPMASRAKESICNLLRGWFDGAVVLDLFSGVGTMGLESISRGAKQAVMVERDRSVMRILERNIALLACADRAVAMQGDALSSHLLESLKGPFDLIFMDPPYRMMELPDERQRVLSQLQRLRSRMGDTGFVVLRSPLDPRKVDHAVPGFDGPEVHRYGQEMFVLLFAPASSGDEAKAHSAPERTSEAGPAARSEADQVDPM